MKKEIFGEQLQNATNYTFPFKKNLKFITHANFILQFSLSSLIKSKVYKVN